jgi:hypothetical protein
MTDAVAHDSYHVLLIGIDDYAKQPLSGCVNDIDAVQQILLERAKVPRDRIRRLASPGQDATCSTDIPAEPATHANLWRAFTALAKRANEGDRVFIYYSGHGTRVDFEGGGGRRFHREALVPADYHLEPAKRLLYDHELNGLLADIAARTRAVTFVLDCCHSAGVTRDDKTPRRLDARRDLGLWAPLPDQGTSAGHDGIGRSVDDCHIVTACLNHELANEAIGDDHKTHGVLTAALLGALSRIPDDELRSVSWRQIWQRMRYDVEDRNRDQHPWMSGHPGRAVLAGRPVDGDPGFWVCRNGRGYDIEAGTLAGVTQATVIAVYGEQPARFPLVDSDDDRKARLGLVRVIDATPSRASATPVGPAFEIPAGARGRIVEAGAPSRLACAIVADKPTMSEVVSEVVSKSALLEIVDPAHARVSLHQVDGHWVLSDSVHAPTIDEGLCVLRPHQLHRARDVLEHYFYYALPLRLAEAAVDLPGALELTVLSCPQRLSPAEAETADLAEAATGRDGRYDVAERTGLCFRVKNRSRHPLRITLVNAGASGRVHILDEQGVDAGHAHTFWADNTIGLPFEMSIPEGNSQAIDWLIAIGTTANRDVRHLRVDRSFADVLATTRGDRDIRGRKQQTFSAEMWTATQVIVKTRTRT